MRPFHKKKYHQYNPKEPQPELLRPNGLLYASAGLAWKRFYRHLNVSHDVYQRVDKTLFEQIDANDAADDYKFEASACNLNIRVNTLSNIISSFNSDRIHDEEAQNAAFAKAAEFASMILKNHIEAAKRHVDECIAFDSLIESNEDGVIVLKQFVPAWREIVLENYSSCNFIITPGARSPFQLLAVPKKLGSRVLKKTIERPQWFDGFIHSGKFIAGCESLEEAKRLASEQKTFSVFR